jgi:hypothetical protein
MEVGKIYFKHFSVKSSNVEGLNFADIVVSLAESKHTLLLIKHLLKYGRVFLIEFMFLKPVFFQWARNQNI